MSFLYSNTHRFFEQELSLCLKAEAPLVFVITQEERRALSVIADIAASLNKKLFFPRIRGQSATVQMLLQKIDRAESVIVLDNIHRILDDANAIRSIADAVTVTDRRTFVVIAPFIHLPPELERISLVLEMPLPDADALCELLRGVCNEARVILSNDDVSQHVRIAQGMTADEALLAFKKAILGWPEDVEGSILSLLSEKKSVLRKSQVLSYVDAPSSMDEVGGLDRLKEWLSSRQSAFSGQAREFGLPAPRGLLLMGVQGCGKSLTAKSVASLWQLPLVRLDLSMLFGDDHPEAAFASAVRVAEAMAPVVLWIDELEKGFDSTGGVSSRVLGGMVTWLQEKQKEVFVVATANRVSGLPPELPRKGRFDEVFFVDLPDEVEREEILRIHLRGYGRNPDLFEVGRLAKHSDKLTGSELEQIVISALYSAYAKGVEINDDHLMFALKETVPLFETFEEEIKSLREWARKRARPASTDRKKAVMFRE